MGWRFSSNTAGRSNGSTLSPWGAGTNPEYTKAVAPMLGDFAKTGGGMASSGAASHATLGGQGMSALADAYRSQAAGVGNAATAMANERSNLYGSNAMAEAARMGAMGNLGSAGLAAYGSMGNNAMQAWAQNQAGYNQSLASMQNANQAAMGGLGVSRNNALGGLAGPMAAQSMASTLGGGGLGFSATAGGSPVASGNVFAPGGGGMSRGDMAGLRQDLMSRDVQDSLSSANTDAMNRLDGQHASSRSMPSQMLSQGFGGLMSLTNNSMGQLNAGMDQFYGNQARAGDQFYAQVPTLLQGLTDASGVTRGDINAMLARGQAGIDGTMNQGYGYLERMLGNLTR
jgi:hypothetical protein